MIVSVVEQAGLSINWSETLKTLFSHFEAHLIQKGLRPNKK